jgi:hypothetical protein
MADEYKGKLIPCKGSGQLRGIIVGKDNPKKGNGFIEGKTNDQVPYRSIRFLVKTNTDNIVPVELYGQVQEKAYLYNKKIKDTKPVIWTKRFDKALDGYDLILPTYDLVKKIDEDFKDGVSVLIIGENMFSEYTPANSDKAQLQTKFTIKIIRTATAPVDFASNKFEEECYFIQEIIIREIVEVASENKLDVYAYVLESRGKKKAPIIQPALFEINTEAADKDFVRNMKALKFGDFIKINGKIQCRALTEEVIENDGWGKKEKAVVKYYKAMEITGAYGETLEKKKYTEEDLVISNTEATFNGTGDAAKKVLEQLEKEAAEGGEDTPEWLKEMKE